MSQYHCLLHQKKCLLLKAKAPLTTTNWKVICPKTKILQTHEHAPFYTNFYYCKVVTAWRAFGGFWIYIAKE